MNIYEALYVAHPNLEDDSLTKLVTATKETVAKRGGELLYEENLGKKRLAYAIEKQRYGTYILLQFQGESVDIVNLEQDFEINDDVLAKIIVAIDEDDIRTAPIVEETVESEKKPAEDAKAESSEPTTEAAEPVAEEKVADDSEAAEVVEPEAAVEAENVEEAPEAPAEEEVKTDNAEA